LDEFIDLANGIQRALFEFDSTSNHAVLRLYNRVDASHASIASASTTDDNSDPFLSGSDNEHVFLVYLYVGYITLFSIGLSFLLTRILFQFHIRYAGVCAGAHIADGRDEQNLCG